MPASLDGVIHVHLHELEDEGEPAGGLVIEHFVELDDLGVGRQASQGLDLTQIVHLEAAKTKRMLITVENKEIPNSVRKRWQKCNCYCQILLDETILARVSFMSIS